MKLQRGKENNDNKRKPIKRTLNNQTENKGRSQEL